MKPKPKIGLIADDLTGALDAGAQFCQYRAVGNTQAWDVNLRISGERSGEVEIINCDSREVEPALAIARVEKAVQLLSGRTLFKKIDSTLRGNVRVEVEAMLAVGGYRRALICPAAPLQGRVLRDGVLYVHGVPLLETAFRDDPVWPAKTSRVVELIGGACEHISLRKVREGVNPLVEAVEGSTSAIIVADAETEADLDTLAQAVWRTNTLPCGAFGLAKAFVDRAPFAERAAEPYTENFSLPCLVIVGSAHQVTRDQVERLLAFPNVARVELPASPRDADLSRVADAAASHAIVVISAEAKETLRTPEWLSFGEKVAAFGLKALERLEFNSIFMIGGETLSAFTKAAGTESVRITGEALPGIPVGVLHGGVLDGSQIITKAGGFGGKDTLVNILFGSER